MVCLREVIDDTVDVGFNILRALDIQLLVGTDMQCVGDTEMVPEKLVQRGVFVDPYDLIDRYDRIAVDGSFNEKMFRDKPVDRLESRVSKFSFPFEIFPLMVTSSMEGRPSSLVFGDNNTMIHSSSRIV